MFKNLINGKYDRNMPIILGVLLLIILLLVVMLIGSENNVLLLKEKYEDAQIAHTADLLHYEEIFKDNKIMVKQITEYKAVIDLMLEQSITKEEKEVEVIVEVEVPLEPPLRIDITDEEIIELAKLVECEAGAESYTCKILTASAIVNRIPMSTYPDNIHEVIYDAPVYNGKKVWQFTPAMNNIIEDKEYSDETLNACMQALEKDYVKGCYIFNNRSLTSAEQQAWFDKFEIFADVDGVQFRK